jgi:hypothetical protein
MKIWLTENDIPALTSFAGNIDTDALKPFIVIAQTNDILPILGVDLYNKINTDIENDTLSGLYLQFYDKFIIFMLAYFSCSHYIAINSSQISQNGIIKPEQRTDLSEINRLSALYNQLGNNVFIQFKDFLQLNPVPEYKIEEVKRETNVIQWY